MSFVHNNGVQHKYGFLENTKDPSSWKPLSLERVVLHEVGFHGAERNQGIPKGPEAEDAAVRFADSHVTDGSVRGNSSHRIVAKSLPPDEKDPNRKEGHFYSGLAVSFMPKIERAIYGLNKLDNRFGTIPYEVQALDMEYENQELENREFYRLDPETDLLVLAHFYNFYAKIINGSSQYAYRSNGVLHRIGLKRLMAHTEALAFILNADQGLKAEARAQGGAIPARAHVAAIEFVNTLNIDPPWDPSDIGVYQGNFPIVQY